MRRGWKRVALEEVAEVRSGLALGKRDIKDPVERPYLRVANVQDGYLDLRVVKTIEVSRADVDRYTLKLHDVLLTEGGDFDKLGRGTVWCEEVQDCLHQNHVFAVRVDQQRLCPFFLAYLTSSPDGKRYFVASSKQSTNLASINSTQLKQFPVALPPLHEQRRIAKILRAWDEAIGKTGRLIAAKERARRALLLSLFGDGRNAHVRHDLVSMSSITTRVRTPDDGGAHPVLTISGRSGFLRQDEKYGRYMAGKSVEGYTLLHRGEFAYNKGNSKTYPQGCVYRLDEDSGLVPHVYISFRLDRNELHSDYFVHLFLSGFLNHQLSRLINSGVRNNGLLNISAEEFFSCKVPVPSWEKQERIAWACHEAEREIALLEQKRDALAKLKRGLMQKLLTGEWQVSALAAQEAAE